MGANRRYANGHRRRILRKRVAAKGLPCAVCGMPIDYGLPAGDEMAYELDEITELWEGGDSLDPANVQPVHRACNRAKHLGKRMAREAARFDAPPPPRASRRW